MLVKHYVSAQSFRPCSHEKFRFVSVLCLLTQSVCALLWLMQSLETRCKDGYLSCHVTNCDHVVEKWMKYGCCWVALSPETYSPFVQQNSFAFGAVSTNYRIKPQNSATSYHLHCWEEFNFPISEFKSSFVWDYRVSPSPWHLTSATQNLFIADLKRLCAKLRALILFCRDVVQKKTGMSRQKS